MHKVRLLLLLGLALAIGGTSVARGQDGTSDDKGQSQIKNRDSKHDKAKNKNNAGHRKHWYSPPHLFHKKHSDASAKAGKNSSTKTANKTNPFEKTAGGSKPSTKNAAATKPVNKTGANSSNKTAGTTKAGQKTVARTNTSSRTIAGNNHAKKNVRHDCTPDEAKKGGCQTDKTRSQKGTASPS